MQNRIFLATLLLVLLAGCIISPEGEGPSISSQEAQFSIVNVQEEHIPKVERYVQEEEEQQSIPLEEISSYVFNDTLPLRILFFNLEDRVSRLTLISKGDFDVVIASVQPSQVEDATSLVQSFADDVEVFIIPFAGTATSSAEVAKRLLVAKVVIPDYESASLTDVALTFRGVERASHGTVLEGQGMEMEFATPFPGEIKGDNNNALSFYLTDRNFSIFFSNDIIEGAMGLLTSEGLREVSVMTIPNYGREFAAGAETVASIMFDKLSPDAVILEGSSIDLENLENTGDERAFPVLYFKTRGVPVYPVGNYDRLRLSYDGTSYNITGVVE